MLKVMPKANQFDVVILSTAEWDNPFWTNKQHTASALASLGYRVLYIESLGLRRPTSRSRDWLRIIKRLFKACSFPKRVQKNLWIWSPLVMPMSSNTVIRLLNRVIFSSSLFAIRYILRFNSSVLLTYNPATRLYLDLRCFRATVYHCVDEISQQPGMNSDLIQLEDHILCTLVDHVYVTSQELFKSRSRFTSSITYYPNVVDNRHFGKFKFDSPPVPSDYIQIKEPRLLFVGAISSYKVDFELIRTVALSKPDWSIVLIGLVGEGDPNTDISVLQDINNIYFLGPKSYQSLPIYMHHAQIGLLPCLINSYTTAMFPMKFFEYLSGGLPVVSTDLPSLDEFKDCFLCADSSSEFIEHIQSLITGNRSINQKLVNKVLSQYTYEQRTIHMMDTINKILASKSDIISS